MLTARSPQVFVAPDARSAEADLLDALAAASDAEPLARRLVVVPSRSLREHLLARLAARRPAWLGVEVATLAGLARTILARAGDRVPVGAAWFAIELERAARARRPLTSAFADFADGWAPLAAAARDLVDAGFAPELAEPLLERIDAERGSLPGRTLERARALVEALGETLAALERRNLAPEAALLERATERVASGGPAAVGARVFLHGFADATGRATDLLAALVGRAGALAWLISPVAADGGRETFGARLRERLEGAGGAAAPIEPRADGPRLARLVSPTPELEARALAEATRDALDQGVSPERIGIVFRDPAAVRAALRRALERIGVPYSASAASGPLTPVAHRARALGRLLARRGDSPVDLACELLAETTGIAAEHRAGVRLALRALGVARLEEATNLDRRALERAHGGGVALPARAGLEDDEQGGERAPRRRLPLPALVATLDRLRALLAALDGWPARAGWRRHLAALESLLAAAGLAGRDDGRDLVAAATALLSELPDDLELGADEAADLLQESWRAGERAPWGGAGGGVQVLSVTEARGRCFARLFLGGLARGGFPRPISEEPVLPDALRQRLRDLLPDLPVKREGHDEERYLFAQLLGAADDVVLSRSAQDAEGRPLPPSPLLEALERGGELATFASSFGGPRPALDRGIAAGLAGREAGLAPHLAPALEEGRRRFAPAALADIAAAAEARRRILAELDSDPGSEEGRRRIRALGPYFGFLGERGVESEIYATTLEAHASCGWRTFLERTLRLEPTPDPLAALPGLDATLIGSAVHRALAVLFADPREAPPASFAEGLTARGRPLAWPSEAKVERVVEEVAAGALADAGLARRGLDRILAHRMRERLAAARVEDERHAGAEVLGVELAGELAVDGGSATPTRVRFVADRLQREGERAVAIDFKTGRVPPDLRKKTAAARADGLRASVASGRRLQGAIYAGAAAAAVESAAGRYLFLGPEDDATERGVELVAGEETATALAATLATILAARRHGLFPPRLLEPRLDREYSGCDHCAVAEACVRRDSGFRLRLERWHERELERSAERGPREAALWRLWRLPAGEGGGA